MTYRHGVLIHNFNEDQFGIDVRSISRRPDPAKISVSHIVHGWKEPTIDLRPKPEDGVERHILFGHAGDMHDPHVTLQLTEHAPAHQYFFQDNGKLSANDTKLSADQFTLTEDPKVAARDHSMTHGSVIAHKIKQRWGDGRQTHNTHSDDRFLSESRRAAEQIHTKGPHNMPAQGLSRKYGEFAGSFDTVKITASARQNSAARSAAKIMGVSA